MTGRSYGTAVSTGPSMLVVKTSTAWPRAASARHKLCTATIGPPYRVAGKYVGTTCRIRIDLELFVFAVWRIRRANARPIEEAAWPAPADASRSAATQQTAECLRRSAAC